MENKEAKEIILTGDRPTGPLHLGHYVGSLKNRVLLQDKPGHTSYIMIADQQALTDNADNPKKVVENVIEVALDYMACGLDPKKSTIFIQSQIPALPELTVYYLNLVTVNRLKRNPTVKAEIQQKAFGQSIPTGFFVYPISQAADITAFKASLVPVGDDQRPMLEQTREIVHSFNQIYGKGKDILTMPDILLAKEGQGRIPGIDGNAKMSKSLGNAIYLKDSMDVVKKKVMSMYTDPNHIRVEDPGQIEGNMVFTYLDIFAEGDPLVAEMKEHYQRGGLGDVKVKRYLIDILDSVLTPIREKRLALAKDPAAVLEMLKVGSERARKTADATLQEVRQAIGVNYFG
ncbi:tryptophan--tRNA ligase [Atopobacter sp. AH10]|uniref:tryptophan--tRNA ligase n=1 Tax=Atopobacter sp. AH10 TaxID=2315861 RepID=UPI000EF23CBD|nr:tryptophan--tRNA ligase [Atopobacter sp. AH10]RLK64209.1 tryptophan--tRNA ligase [Atopobacter sp. AH10]